MSWSRIKSYAEQLIPVIRQNDPDTPVLVGTRAWFSLGVSEGSDETEIVNSPVNASNIMYTFHFYAASHGTEYLDTLSRAADRLPMFVTEFGTQTASGDGGNNFSRAQQYIDLMASKKISWSNWNYSDDSRSGAVFKGGTCDNNGPWTGTGPLKPAGVWVRDRTRTPDDFPTGSVRLRPAGVIPWAGGGAQNGAAVTSYRQPGILLTDRRFTVPLDHADPAGEQLQLYGREVVASGRAGADLPWLVYLEGGPGFGSRRFIGKQAWLGRAVQEFRVLLLDQRGTGRSTPQNRQTLPLRGGPQAQAEHLAHFRADSIVRDCETIRPQVTGGAPWTVLGQSFGGFCATHYLSTAPEGLRTVIVTGGLPALDVAADDVYRAAYPRIQRKVEAHYDRYPQDVRRARRIAEHLAEHRPVLPGGYTLTPEAFQSLGILLGGGDGSHQLHYLLEDAFVRTGQGHELSDAFQQGVLAALSYAAHPLYAVLHEAIYAQGAQPTAWAAERVRAEFPQFDAAKTLAGDGPLLFTGESVHPWHFEADPALRPLRQTAELLAARTDWTPLYDPARLAANEVPVAAAIYHDDMYVDTEHSLRTARTIRGLRTWVTDEYEHDGVRASGTRVLDRLLALARGDA